ncbi:hypothetical protein HF290_07760 [Acidithiobacillus ferrooxidans]|uniref:hypothetical protein n=1 Tax=Acidithiobacillus ferrooxidans TaxID=920 RepID=UPI001C07DC72|nr:hypothetical protein [Acidithiobacillus ferrooxidans]MBU2860299.1 hypothetical protein [Acidithiobacillus ferrooxidans]
MDIARRRVGGDKYRDQVIALVSRRGYRVSDSTHDQDMKEASDLILNGKGCALRIRSEKAMQRWPDEFTIRATRPDRLRIGKDTSDTEFQKIMAGHARYAVYGFADSNDRIVLMRLLDLNVFRASIMENHERYDRSLMYSDDGVGYFVFNVREFPATLIRHVWDYRH